MADLLRGRTVAGALAAVVVGLAALPVGAPGAAAGPVGAAGGVAPALDPLPGEWWWTRMGVDDLHEHGTGEGITVAVVDGPIDTHVPDLAGRVESTSTTCLDPTKDSGLRSPEATGHEAEHATSMAALIAGTGRGTGPGGRGIRGIAPDATIRHYAVLYRDPDDPQQYLCGTDLSKVDATEEALGRAIAQAARDGADVINLSLVTGYSQEIVDGLLEAYRDGAIVVAGTANTRTGVEWPGIGNGVVLVNPVGRDGEVTDFAVSRSRDIALTAPGEDVTAGVYDDSGWHSTGTGSGSSIATALVSGGIAAVWSAHPEAGAGQVLQAVKRNVGLRATRDGSGYRTWFRRVGSDLPQVTTHNDTYGWGIFDPADAAVVDPSGLPRDNPFVRDGRVEAPSAAEVAAAASDATGDPSAAPSSGPSSTAPAGTVADTAAAPPERSRGGDDSGLVPWLAGGVALVVALAAAGLWRRGRTPGPTAATPPATTVPSGSGDRAVPVPGHRDPAASATHGPTGADRRND